MNDNLKYKIRFNIEYITESSIRGWVINENNSDEVLECELKINDLIIKFKNNVPRRDLLKKDMTTEGLGGFFIELPEETISDESILAVKFFKEDVFKDIHNPFVIEKYITLKKITLDNYSSKKDFFKDDLDFDRKYLYGISENDTIKDMNKIFLNYKQEAKIKRLESPSIAMIKTWNNKEFQFDDEININILHFANVFRGKILKREGKYHYNSQLLLTKNYELIPSSYCIMDGTNVSVPGDIISAIGSEYFLKKQQLELMETFYVKGYSFFIGSIHRHFGHFLVEGLSRLWALSHLPKYIKKGMKYIIYEDNLKPYVYDMLLYFGIRKEDIVLHNKHLLCEKLIVPDISYRTHRWYSLLHMDMVSTIKKNITIHQKHRKIFLSRQFIPDRPLSNRDSIELLFKSFGYEIISPERLSIKEQITNIMEASHIAGEVGSHMYMSIFAEPSTEVFVISPNNFYLKDDYLLSKLAKTNLSVLLGTGIDFSEKKAQMRWSVQEFFVKDYLTTQTNNEKGVSV